MCPDLDNPENKAFVKLMAAKYGDKMVSGLPSFMDVEAWDGMQMIFHMLKATGGKADGDKMMAAIKGYSFKSPRGTVTVDPNTRELTPDRLCDPGREGEWAAQPMWSSRAFPM